MRIKTVIETRYDDQLKFNGEPTLSCLHPHTKSSNTIPKYGIILHETLFLNFTKSNSVNKLG